MPDRYAIIGHPVAHSRSPWIHAQFAHATGEDIEYGAIDVPPAEFARAVERFRGQGGKGLNVTLPFKPEAFRLCAETSARAAAAQAVNTLVLDRARLYGDNTDGAGLTRDLQDNAGFSLTGKRILVLGAGGAVRGVLEPFLAQRPAVLVIANRTVSKAEQLVREFADLGPLVAAGFDWLDAPVDLIVNGTSASLGGELPPIAPSLIQPGHTVCVGAVFVHLQVVVQADQLLHVGTYYVVGGQVGGAPATFVDQFGQIPAVVLIWVEHIISRRIGCRPD